MTEQLAYDHATERDDEGRETAALATHGHFSTRFYLQCQKTLETAPDLVSHIVQMRTARGGGDGERIQATKDIPLPFNAQAWDDANEIYRLLVYWTNVWAGLLRRQAPGPAKRAWTNERGKIVGLPVDVTARDARYAVSIMSQWLLIHLDDILHSDPVEVTQFNKRDVGLGYIFGASQRWPRRDSSRWSKLPCPRCAPAQVRIAIYPPSAHGRPQGIECEAGHRFTENEYETAVRELAESTKEAQKLAAKYAPELMRKYAR